MPSVHQLSMGYARWVLLREWSFITGRGGREIEAGG